MQESVLSDRIVPAVAPTLPMVNSGEQVITYMRNRPSHAPELTEARWQHHAGSCVRPVDEDYRTLGPDDTRPYMRLGDVSD
jgi:hypothetical protein